MSFDASAASSKNNSTNGKRIVGRPFRKGRSGNPSGRPKSITVVLREAILEHAARPVGKGKTRLTALIERLYEEDPKTYLAYGWGKPVETCQLAGPSGGDTSVISEEAINMAQVLVRRRIEEEWDEEIRRKVEAKYHVQTTPSH